MRTRTPPPKARGLLQTRGICARLRAALADGAWHPMSDLVAACDGFLTTERASRAYLQQTPPPPTDEDRETFLNPGALARRHRSTRGARWPDDPQRQLAALEIGRRILVSRALRYMERDRTTPLRLERRRDTDGRRVLAVRLDPAATDRLEAP